MRGDIKGRAGEREAAQLLQKWWSRVDPDIVCIRTPLSGGWASANVRGEFRACGDIMTTSPSFPFVVEVKRRESWAPARLLEGKTSPVWGWWGEAVAAANESRVVRPGDQPLLMLRKNRMEWLAMLPADFAAKVRGMPSPDARWTERQLRLSEVDYADELPVLYFAAELWKIDPKVVVGA